VPFLRRGGSVARTGPDDVVRERPWDDPGLDEVLDRLADLPGPEAVDAALTHLAPLRHQPERQVQAVQAFAARLTGALADLERRAGTAHRDDAEAADALGLLGVTLTARGWEVRGSGRASTVSPEAAAEFLRLLAQADEVLVSALARVPDHPAAATGRLRTALGAGVPEQDWWERFDAARQARSTLFPAHWTMLMALCSKWYGSDEQMFDFALEVARSAPEGDPVVAVLPLAHIEFYPSVYASREKGNKTLAITKRYNRIRPDVVAAADRWCGSGTVPPHPRNGEAHQLFGWFFAGVDKDRARWHLERAGLRIGQLPWNYLDVDPVAAFLRTRQKAGLT
jgi:hypothetical protein